MNRPSTFATIFAGAALAGACGSSGSGAHSPPSPTPTTAALTAPPTTIPPIAVFRTSSNIEACPSSTPPTSKCLAVVGEADVAGLGHAAEHYTLLQETPKPTCPDWRANVQWTLTGKGTIHFAVKTTDCPPANTPDWTMQYIVTGGTGAYKGASGTGTVGVIYAQAQSDTWTGTLSISNHPGR